MVTIISINYIIMIIRVEIDIKLITGVRFIPMERTGIVFTTLMNKDSFNADELKTIREFLGYTIEFYIRDGYNLVITQYTL